VKNYINVSASKAVSDNFQVFDTSQVSDTFQVPDTIDAAANEQVVMAEDFYFYAVSSTSL